MKDRDAIQMMQRCAEEIRCLRRANSDMAPRAEAYDTIRAIIDLLPRRTVGHGEDLVWRLEREIAELESADRQAETDHE